MMRRRLGHRRAERGETLIETITTIAIFGLVIPAILLGLYTAVRSSRTSDSLAKVDAVLSRASEKLGSTPYVPCPVHSGTNEYLPIAQSAASSIGWPASKVSISSIKYWNPSSATFTSTNLVRGSECTFPGPASSRALQLITVTVNAPVGGITRSIEVVKTNVVPRENPI